MFAQAYDEVLKEELGDTLMGQRQNSASGVVVDLEEPEGDELLDQGIGEDLAAIEDILTSVKLQDGLPGPATNLMGMLGVSIPKEALRRRGDGQEEEGGDKT